MYCSNCGVELPTGSNFCYNCGRKTDLQLDGLLAEKKPFEKPDAELFGCSESIDGNAQTNLHIVQVGPRREAVMDYIKSLSLAEMPDEKIAEMKDGNSYFIGQFDYDTAKLVLIKLRGWGCKAEIQDCTTLKQIGKNYDFAADRVNSSSKGPAQPLRFSTVVGAVVLGNIICSIASWIFISAISPY